VHKMEFGQYYCRDLLNRVKKNLLCIFLMFESFSMNFGNLSELEKTGYWSTFGPQPLAS
jgi:hypothetical protein